MKKTLTAISAAIAFFLLILDGETALLGAQEGIKLCAMAVVPSLFPLFVVSMVLCGNLTAVSWKPARFLAKICRMPSGSECFLVPAFLSGYPAGAQALGQGYKEGRLSQKTASRMLSFCNNTGPAFLFGMVGPQFPEKWMAVALWLIHMVSALLVGVISPGKSDNTVSSPSVNTISLQQALKKSVRVMADICGWIILFRVILAFLHRWILGAMPNDIAILLSGILELSNGCLMLKGIEQVGLRFILASGLLGFGGLCVGMQTAAVAEGLPMTSYWKGKGLQTVISVLLAGIVQFLFIAA